MIGVVLITHGHFGRELLQTAQDISGHQENVATISVTSETGKDDLGKSIDETVKLWGTGGGVLFLVDMLGGTPCNVALMRTRDHAAEVVSGVNLYMVISALRHRDEMALKALADKVAEDGRRAIVLPKDLLSKKLG